VTRCGYHCRGQPGSRQGKPAVGGRQSRAPVPRARFAASSCDESEKNIVRLCRRQTQHSDEHIDHLVTALMEIWRRSKTAGGASSPASWRGSGRNRSARKPETGRIFKFRTRQSAAHRVRRFRTQEPGTCCAGRCPPVGHHPDGRCDTERGRFGAARTPFLPALHRHSATMHLEFV